MRDIREGTAYQAGFPTGRPAPYTSYTTAQQNQQFDTPQYVPSGSVRALQAFLKNKGYNIQVDGIRGPQTEAAITAYHNGIAPRAWNTRSTHASPAPARTMRPGAMPPPTRRAPTPVRRVATGRAPVSRTTNPMQAATAAAANAGMPGLTAEQIAQAQVDSLYGPQMDAIRQQIAATQAAGAQQVANLGRWYGQVGQTAQASAQQTAASDQALQAQQQTGQQNMLQLFGGPGANGPAGEAAAFSDINNAALQQLSAAGEQYANAQPTIVGLQGTEAQNAAQQSVNAAVADLASQLASLQANRGSDYTKALYQVQQDQYQQQQDTLKNQREQQALDLAMQLAPSQVATARANARLATTRANLAPVLAARDAKSFGMTQQRIKAEIAATKARTQQILAGLKKGANGGIDWNDPNTRSSLLGQLRPVVQTKGGTWRMHPGAAQANLDLALQTMGLQNNPNAIAIKNQLLQQTVQNSRSRGMWTQFTFKNGKIVKGQRTPLGRRMRAAQQKAAAAQAALGG